MKSILVTGATGFVGRYLIEQLLEQGFTVSAMLRSETSNPLPSSVRIIQGDLTNLQSLQQVCAGIDTVFHLAGHAHAWAEKNNAAEQKHHQINFLGTQHLLQAALGSGVKKFIYFSTVKAVADAKKCIDETFEVMPNTPYGMAKRQAEQLVLEAGRQQAMHVCILRPTLVYGPGVKGNLQQMLSAVEKGYFPPLPEVPYYRSMVSVNDLCRAAILVAQNPMANGKIYIVSDGQKYSVRQLYNLMRQSLGCSIPKWQVPYGLLNAMARSGDLLEKCLGKRFPLNSAALEKLLGAAEYNSNAIQQELNFHSQDTFAKILPMMWRDKRK